jgi:hypothetical protein
MAPFVPISKDLMFSLDCLSVLYLDRTKAPRHVTTIYRAILSLSLVHGHAGLRERQAALLDCAAANI